MSWANRFEMQSGVPGILPPEPVILPGHAPDRRRQRAVAAPETLSGVTPHGSGVHPPPSNSAIASCASRSSGPPGRASSWIWASQSASHRRSSRSLSSQRCLRGNRSMAASISATVLTAEDYLLPTHFQPSLPIARISHRLVPALLCVQSSDSKTWQTFNA
jgi:hypothetical protein